MALGFHVVPDQVMFQRSYVDGQVTLTASFVARFTDEQRKEAENGLFEMGFPRRGERLVLAAELCGLDQHPPLPAKSGIVTLWWDGPVAEGGWFLNVAVVFDQFPVHRAKEYAAAGALAREILNGDAAVLVFRRLPSQEEESWVKELSSTGGDPKDPARPRWDSMDPLEWTGPATFESCLDAGLAVDLDDDEDDDDEEAGPDVDFAYATVVPLYRAWRRVRMDPGGPWPEKFPSAFRPRPAETPYAFARRMARPLAEFPGGEEACTSVGGDREWQEWVSWLSGVMQWQGDRPTPGPEAEPEAQTAISRALVGQMVLSDRAVAAGRKRLSAKLQWAREQAAAWAAFKLGGTTHPTLRFPFVMSSVGEELDRLRRDERPEAFARTVVAATMYALRWSREDVAAMNAAGGIDKYAAIVHATVLAEVQSILRWSPIPGLEDWTGPLAGAGD